MSFHPGGIAHLAALHVGEETEIDGFVTYVGHQRRILKQQRSIIVRQRHLRPSQPHGMCRRGEREEIKDRCTFRLCRRRQCHTEGKPQREDDEFRSHESKLRTKIVIISL